MPFNGNGVFNRLYSWAQDAANNINILASRMDNETNGIAQGLTNCVTRDGQSPALADLPMGGHKIINLADPAAATDAATKQYVDAQSVAQTSVSILPFLAPGFDPDTDDATSALNAAIASLGPDGGFVAIPPFNQLKMNAVITQTNITLQGQGGDAENDVVCIRPFDITKPTITFGDGVNYYRNCGLSYIHVSGSDGSTSGVTQAAHNAPQALLLLGGMVDFNAVCSVIYNGVQTLSLLPSATVPVTACNFIACTLRNDLTDSASARTIYGKRRADPGYLTSIKFIGTKVNGPTLGYVAEIDGSVAGWTFDINDCYFDLKGDHGILLKGAAGINSYNSQLDPGALNVNVIETDQTISDISRYITGNLICDIQKMKFSGGSVSIPSGTIGYSFGTRHYSPYLGDFGFFTVPATPFAQTVGWVLSGTTMSWVGGAHIFPASVQATGFNVASLQVVGARQPNVAKAALSSPNANETALKTSLDGVIDLLRTHGLMA